MYKIGPFVPEVSLSDPEAVKQLHREFVRAGSDVVEAFTYYAHRSKLVLIGKEELVEKLNRQALKIAREVINEFPDLDLLFAGNISNTTVYNPDDQNTINECKKMFREQIQWAKEANVDYIIAETFSYLGEALLALEIIKEFNLPSVVTLAIHTTGLSGEGNTIEDCFKQLSKAGANVVGLNCSRGPTNILDLLKQVVGKIDTPLACLPAGYRTDDKNPTMQSFTAERDRKYTDLDPHTCTRYDFGDFTTEANKLGIKYIGTCCGSGPHHVRAIAEALGRKPIASKYSPNLDLHFAFGKKVADLKSCTDDKTIDLNFKYGDTM